jgi:hypothetical protein
VDAESEPSHTVKQEAATVVAEDERLFVGWVNILINGWAQVSGTDASWINKV